MKFSDNINLISDAFTGATHNVTLLERSESEKIANVTFDSVSIENYDEMDKTIKRANEYRSDFVAGLSLSLSDIAKEQFEEHDDVTHVESTHELGGEKLTVTVVREDKRVVDDEIETVENNIRVFSESDLCTCLDDVRSFKFDVDDE